MAGGAHFPYPKEVWSPSGGWWSRPSNWKMNTLLTGVVIGVMSVGIWRFSTEREERLSPPVKPIPSRYWSQKVRDLGIKVE